MPLGGELNPGKINFRQLRLEAEVSLSHPMVLCGSWELVWPVRLCTGEEAQEMCLNNIPVGLETGHCFPSAGDRPLLSFCLLSLRQLCHKPGFPPVSRKVVCLPFQALRAKSSIRGQLQVDNLPWRQMGYRGARARTAAGGSLGTREAVSSTVCSSGMR